MENANVERRLPVCGTKFVIALAVVILIFPLASASGENITFLYPSSVNYGENFSVNVELINFSENLYDVKIDVWNSTARISQIYNGTIWRSTTYYVLGAINTSVANSSSFDLNITKVHNGTALINVTIRKNGVSTLYKFGSYPIEINFTGTNETNNTADEDENITDEDEINDTTQNITCDNGSIIQLLSYPSSMDFGSSGYLDVFLNGSCYNYGSIKFLTYGDPKRVISDSSDSKITSYAQCQNGIEESTTNQSYNFSIRFYAYSNCDNYYENGEHTVALRACNPASPWEKYSEFLFNITFSGNDDCPSEESGGSSSSSSAPVKAGNKTKAEKKNESKNSSNGSNSNGPPVFKIGGGGNNESADITGKAIVSSKDEKIKQISIYMFIGTLAAAAIYLAWLQFMG